jgi:hypothetical protein
MKPASNLARGRGSTHNLFVGKQCISSVNWCQQLLPRIRCGNLLGIAEVHMRRMHTCAGAIGVCGVPSTHPCHLVSTVLHVPGVHILEAHIPGAQMLGHTCLGARMVHSLSIIRFPLANYRVTNQLDLSSAYYFTRELHAPYNNNAQKRGGRDDAPKLILLLHTGHTHFCGHT